MPVSQGLAAVQVARVFGLLQQGPFLSPLLRTVLYL